MKIRSENILYRATTFVFGSPPKNGCQFLMYSAGLVAIALATPATILGGLYLMGLVANGLMNPAFDVTDKSLENAGFVLLSGMGALVGLAGAIVAFGGLLAGVKKVCKSIELPEVEASAN